MTKEAGDEKPPFRWKVVLVQIALVSVAVAVVALIGKVGTDILYPKPGDRPTASRTTGTALIGGPFAMVDQDGKPVDQTVLNGKWSAVFFGYTFCPDVCPGTLTTLAAAQQRMGAKGKALQTVFVSIDPERDTPAQLKTYLESPAFPRPVIGLTGTAEQVKATAAAYRAYYAKAEGTKPGDRDYLMDHGSAIYLMNPRGEFSKLIDPALSPDDMAKAISEGMAG
jgi:protein SCO1/2